MEYSVRQLARLAGVSARTLRYYDEFGLLKPRRIRSNGYRVYGSEDLETLQHILLYRELELPLDTIKDILQSKGFDGKAALREHLEALRGRRDRLDKIIQNVEITIQCGKEGKTMSDSERFEAFKRGKLDENERKYGAEIREKYGQETVEASNRKFMSMTEQQHAQVESLSAELNETLRAAFETGDCSSDLAMRACALHKQWLCFYWTEYSPEAHAGLAQMYVDDERFSAYYDKIAPGCAVFLRDAINEYLRRQA